METLTVRFVMVKTLAKEDMEVWHRSERELGRLWATFEIGLSFRENKYWPVDVENDWGDFEKFYKTQLPKDGELGNAPDFVDYQHAWDWNVWHSDYTIEKSKSKAHIRTLKGLKTGQELDNDELPQRKTVEYGKGR